MCRAAEGAAKRRGNRRPRACQSRVECDAACSRTPVTEGQLADVRVFTQMLGSMHGPEASFAAPKSCYSFSRILDLFRLNSASEMSPSALSDSRVVRRLRRSDSDTVRSSSGSALTI